jgi:DNA-binding transcriptional MerR regulator
MDYINIGLWKLITPETSAIIILIIMIFLIRRQEDKIDNLANIIKEREERMENKIKDIEKEIKDFITKEEHYRDVSGWRGELQKLENKLDRFIEKFLDTRRE